MLSHWLINLEHVLTGFLICFLLGKKHLKPQRFLCVCVCVFLKCFVEQNWFHLIGIICGLAIYNSTVVDLHFPLALYKKLLDVLPTLDDFKELSPTEARSNGRAGEEGGESWGGRRAAHEALIVNTNQNI